MSRALAENRRTVVKATIKRASAAGRRDMRVLDRKTQEQIDRLYRQAAASLETAIRGYAGIDGSLRLEVMQDLLAQANHRLALLSDERNGLLNSGMTEAARTGAAAFAAAGASVTRIADEALRFARTFVAEDGLQLSDRLWRLDRAAREQVGEAIQSAIIQGHSASQATTEFLTRGEPVPADIAAKRGLSNADTIARDAGRALLKDDGSARANALRVFRTEINRAHGQAYQAGAFDTPGVIGTKFMLSPAHPAPDICVRAGAIVLTDRGPIPIEAVDVGDKVLTDRGRWRAVITLMRRRIDPGDPVIELEVNHESELPAAVVLTPNHPVLTAQGWLKAADLRTGNRVRVVRGAIRSHQFCGDLSDKAPSGSRGSWLTRQVENIFARARDGLRGFLARHILRSDRRYAVEPKALRTFARQIGDCVSSRLSSLDFLRPCAAGTSFLETRAFDGTIPCAPSRTLGCFLQIHRTIASKTFFRSHAVQMEFYRSDISEYGTHPNNISVRENASEIPFDIDGTFSESYSRSYISNGMITSARLIKSNGEIVYNLEIEEDHTYTVNGLVVHNCDMHASVNRYGLGAGVYPPGKSPWPAHPNTLSFEVAVFADEVTSADRAGEEDRVAWLLRQPGSVQQSVLASQKKRAALLHGLLREHEIATPWNVLKPRLARRGVDVDRLVIPPEDQSGNA